MGREGRAIRLDDKIDPEVAAYDAGNIDAMGPYLHPDVIIIFPDGRVLEGLDGLREYYERMIESDDPVVASFGTDPEVDIRAIHGDTIISQGHMNDRYVLTDGTELNLDSRFTVSLIRMANGPEETGGFVIRSFHCSTNAFDNDVLSLAVRKSAGWAGAIAGVMALLLGLVIGVALGRRSKRKPTQPAAA